MDVNAVRARDSAGAGWDNFEVSAGWRNDGGADLMLGCRVCDWWHEWEGSTGGGEGRALFGEVVLAAIGHWNGAHGSGEVPSGLSRETDHPSTERGTT